MNLTATCNEMPRGKPFLSQRYQAIDWISVFLDMRVYCWLNNSKIWCFWKGLAHGCLKPSSTDGRVANMTHPTTDGWLPRREVQMDGPSPVTPKANRNIFVLPDIEHTSE
jgi:hypothetical protein